MKTNSPRQSGRRAELPLIEELTIEQSTLEPKAVVVLKLLRRTAIQHQTDRASPFYSVRAVAKRFALSPATVSRIYQQLTSERLLRPVWGSRTLLEPLESTQRRTPQSVAIPVELVRFGDSHEYRKAILGAQCELWNNRVIAHLLFFERSAEEVLHLLARYHRGSVDAVLWILPESVPIQALLAPRELGVRVACIAPSPIGGIECYTIPADSKVSKIVREQLLKTR